LDRRAYYQSGGRGVRLDQGAAEREVLRLLDRRGLPAKAQVDVDESRVTIALRDQIETSFLRLIGVSHLTVGADAAASPLAGSP
jgi:hypothetical protein